MTDSGTDTEWRFFWRHELACRHCGQMEMHPETMQRLVAMREALGFPLPVSSGYRCPEYNAQVSSTGRSGPHTTGRALDILANGRRQYEILTAALERGFTGIGVARTFIHIDTVGTWPRPNVWTY